ncbi:MAG TPA: alpha/beta fold hydrolase [Phycisphaerae bacterium]|nr:alpha/beta fold hydrolase [Phycisphaerae bacterium]HOJ72553.1 alpha/beta fold hydrolase [Phycisphaerae bacterium]HOM49786.1 alpha/beta fold hydrolase [Phycisphaerae bacterium]HOQ85542.1 alpha/beta fold hydrolase [Phycisphaerae bacterium]HPP25155.1 alpha/beta fold hydrolase [Phycisphaerae bacterium]
MEADDSKETLTPDVSADRPAPASVCVSRRRCRLIAGGVFVTLAYSLWCGGLYLFQDGLVFPAALAPAPDSNVPDTIVQLAVETEQGRSVPGFFIRHGAAAEGKPGPAVIFFHGNAEIIDFQSRVEEMYGRLGVSVLLPEYRGYGRARHVGSPSQEALVADGVKFYDELIKRPDVDPARVIIHGYSIGGGVAAQVATQRRPAALILEATFTSLASFAWRYGVPPALSRHPFRTDEVLPGLGVPLFIAHGRHDTIVPVEHGRRLHALVPTSTYIELEQGHMDLPGDAPEDPYREEIRKFLVRNRILGE